MRTVSVLALLFHAQMALAQFWPMQNQTPYNQVPPQAYGYPGYSVMPGRVQQPTPWFRQPLPYFQQSYGQYPYNMWGGGYGGFGPRPQMFPNQSMSPFGMSPFMGGMNSQSRFGLNLNFDLDQLFGGGSNRRRYDDDYCDYCERRRSASRPSRIHYRDDDYDDDYDREYDRDYDRPSHTEARERYVRQSDYPPPPPERSGKTLPPRVNLEESEPVVPPPRRTAQPTQPTEPPDTTSATPPPLQAPGSTAGQDKPSSVPGGGGERVAGQESKPAPSRPAPPPLKKATPRPGKELPPDADEVEPTRQPGVSIDRPNPNPQGQVLIRVEARDADERLAQRHPFFQLFMHNWNACIKEGYIPEGCEPNRYAISRPHAGHSSCHGVNAAIDVHNIVCNKDYRHPHRAIDNGQLWKSLIACMGGHEGGLNKTRGQREATGRMGVIWRQPIRNNSEYELRTKHHTHAHFSPKEGCRLTTGIRYW